MTERYGYNGWGSYIAGVIGFFCGSVTGWIEKDIAITKSLPKTVYVRDVNGDSLQDVITRSKGTLVFLGQQDGTYRRLDEVLSEQRQHGLSLTQSRELIKSIEAKVQDLK